MGYPANELGAAHAAEGGHTSWSARSVQLLAAARSGSKTSSAERTLRFMGGWTINLAARFLGVPNRRGYGMRQEPIG
jgi:hypothetical protein